MIKNIISKILKANKECFGMKLLKVIKKTVLVAMMTAVSAAFAEEVTITILETSDLHGAIYPYDYASDKESDNGLAKVATVIKSERAKDPELLLIDDGDNLQDNMIQEFRFDKKNPMVTAMNALNYDVHVLGNHEFNFEFKTLLSAIDQYACPVITANIYKKDGSRFTAPYLIKEVKGVKVAVIGLTAPHVDRWEAANPEHYDYMTFTEPVDEIAKVIEEIGDQADVIICSSHYGLTGEYDSIGMAEIAERYGSKVPVYLIGHAHALVNQKASNGAILVEPASKGNYVSKVTMTVDKTDSSCKLVSLEGENIPVKGASVEADEEILKLTKNAHTKSLKLANKTVGKIKEDMMPSQWWNGLEGIPEAQVEDTAMMDLINTVQMKYADADVSMAALFSTASTLSAGNFKKRDGIKIYQYDNTLFRVKCTGKQLKTIMEMQAGNYFNQFKPGDVTISFNPDIRVYAYDMFAGVDYDIDISKPAGSRIQNVMFKGESLKDDQELVLAINNYRYGVLSSMGLLSRDPADYTDTALAIRDLISEYVSSQKGGVTAECDHNWKIVGADIDAEQAAKVYALVKEGKISIPTSADGRTVNIKSLNYNELKSQGLVD